MIKKQLQYAQRSG